MASTNRTRKGVGGNAVTHEGGRAFKQGAAEELRRTIMCCMLWEDNFYEDGISVADRIATLAKQVNEKELREILNEAKFVNKLRHAPLYLLVQMAANGVLSKDDVSKVLTRADDAGELLALYYGGKKKPIAKSILKGIAEAFGKFSEYELAKYNRSREFTLKDILRLTHPKPANDAQSDLWKRLLNDTLATPDTWEVAISACGNDSDRKRDEFTRLIEQKKLGDLAFLRNLRNFEKFNVDRDVVMNSFKDRKWSKILPYQFIAAARHAPWLEAQLEQAMFQSLGEEDKLNATVNLLIDVSGSMADSISAKGELTRLDTAKGLAMLLREIVPVNNLRIYKFNTGATEITNRRGFALADAIGQASGGTEMWKAVRDAGNKGHKNITIVITDEQTSDNGVIKDANSDLLIIVNVADYKNGVGYGNGSVHISGWSEKIVDYIKMYYEKYVAN